MRTLARILFLLTGIFFLGAGLSAKSGDGLDLDAERARLTAKADYLYLEASTAFSEERFDDYYALLRQAAALSPEDAFIRGDIAEMDLLSPLTDSLGREEAYKALRQRFLESEGDMQLAGPYAREASKRNRFDDLEEMWTVLSQYHPERSDLSLNLASVLVIKSMRGDSTAYDRALAIYNRLLEGLPGDVGITSYKIRAYSSKKDTSAIIDELGSLISSAPQNLSVLLYAANAYSAISKEDSALKYLDLALELEPESGEVFLNRAAFFEKAGDAENYDREVFNALGSSDLDFEPKLDILVHYVRGLFEDKSNKSRVDAMFQRLLELNPGESRLHAMYGAFEETQGNVEDAIEQYSYSLDLDPNQPDIWMGYLRMLSAKDDRANLLTQSIKASKIFPEEVTFSMAAAGMLMVDGKKSEALALLDSVSRDALKDPEAASRYYGTRGDLYEALGKRDSAYAEYTRAIELNPHNTMAMNNMAYFMALDSVKLDVANAYASMAVTSEPKNPTYLDTYAWVEFRRRNFEHAKKLIDEALAVYEQDTIASLPTDSIDMEALNTSDEEAVEEYVQVVDQEFFEPTSEIYDHAGDIYFWNGLYGEAVKFWEKAAALAPDDEKIKKKVTHKTYFP